MNALIGRYFNRKSFSRPLPVEYVNILKTISIRKECIRYLKNQFLQKKNQDCTNLSFEPGVTHIHSPNNPRWAIALKVLHQLRLNVFGFSGNKNQKY